MAILRYGGGGGQGARRQQSVQRRRYTLLARTAFFSSLSVFFFFVRVGSADGRGQATPFPVMRRVFLSVDLVCVYMEQRGRMSTAKNSRAEAR